jgi:hypothetical protein
MDKKGKHYSQVILQQYLPLAKNNGVLPLWLISFDVFLIITNIHHVISKSACYSTYREVVNGLGEDLNYKWLSAENMVRFCKRARLHFSKYRTYLNSMADQIKNTTSGVTSLVIQSDVRIASKSKISYLKDINQAELFSGQIYRIKIEAGNEYIESYKLAELKPNAIEDKSYQYLTGFGASKWLSCQSLRLPDEFNWFNALEALLKTMVVDLVIYKVVVNEAVPLNTLVGVMNISDSKMNQNVKIDLSITNQFAKELISHVRNISSNDKLPLEVRLKSAQMSIEFTRDGGVLKSKGKVLQSLPKCTLDEMFKPLIKNIKNASSYRISIFGKVEKVVIVINQLITQAIPSGILIKVNLIISSLSNNIDKPKLVISAGKGSGKTSLIKPIEKDKAFVMDSDDWGNWLLFYLRSLNIKNLQTFDDYPFIEDEVYKSVVLWYQQKNLTLNHDQSIFNDFSKYLITSFELADVAKQYALFLLGEKFEKKDTYFTMMSEIQNGIVNFNKQMSEFHQRMLQHKYLSIRQFEIGLSQVDDYINVPCIIQLVHIPVESNFIIPYQSFINMIPVIDPEATIVFRWMQDGLEETDVILQFASDLFLKWYYDSREEIRDVVITPYHVGILIERFLSVKLYDDFSLGCVDGEGPVP